MTLAATRLALVALLAAAACRPVPRVDSADEFRNRVAREIHEARNDLDDAVARLRRASAASELETVNRRLPLVAQRDTIYRKLLHLRELARQQEIDSLLERVDLRRSPPLLGVSDLPITARFADGRHWMLRSHLVHRFGDTHHVIVVPAGFVTDLASVPDVAESLIPREGEYSNAAIIHDYLYWVQSCTREQADNLMAIAMRDIRVQPWKEVLIHGAVRVGGRGAWDRNRSRRSTGVIRTLARPEEVDASIIDWPAHQRRLTDLKAAAGAEPPVPDHVCAMGSSTRRSSAPEEQAGIASQ